MLRGETYVVRIYRREGYPDRSPKGVVEIVRQGRVVSFSGYEALRAILARPSLGVRKGTWEPPPK
jgi:hypothetical protein